MVEVKKVKHFKDGTTTVHLMKDGLPHKIDNAKPTPKPSLINALASLDIHGALLIPRMLQPEEHKRKKMKLEGEGENGKPETWFRPEFESKETAESFHCIGFSVSDKGMCTLVVNVKGAAEDGGSMNCTTPAKSLNEQQAELFSSYEFLEDLRRCIDIAKAEGAAYADGQFHLDASTGGETGAVKEITVNKVKGIGGKEDGFVDPGQRLKEVNETIEKGKDGETWEELQARTAGTRGAAAKRTGKGKQQTPDNPAGK